jgi:DNA-binding LytR/AlgR family response regulator
MNCYVIEDDKIQQHILLNHISKIENINVVGVFEDVINIEEKILVDQPDLIFLDVELPGISGVEFLKKASLPCHTKVVMVTSSKNYALDGYENDVLDYLLKPVSVDRFKKAVNKFIEWKKIDSDKGFLYVRSNGADVKLFYQDILRVKAASEYIIIYTTNGKCIVYSTMSSIMEKLTDGFIRIHRSHIVSVDKIEKINSNSVEINGEIIRVSKSYKKELDKITKV